jgi:secretion-regulating guanine nucleotide exchange factor
MVYVWGDNSFGQLATNDRDDRWSPIALSEALFAPSRLGLKIKSIDCGFYHTAVLTDSGLFTAGQGICGQLGHSDTNDSLVFRFVNGLPKASMLAQVCCGYSHTIVRTEQGDLWSFGTNLYGQLGLGHKNDPVPEPRAVAELGETKRILEVACGSFTTSALTSLGNILMWGRAGSSKSSIASDDPAFDIAVPKLVDTLHGASCSRLASGPNHSIAITEKGTIYVWGPAGRSMASSRLVMSEPLSPGILAEFLPGSAMQLACGDECNMILTTSGTLFACGRGGFGKLGTGSTVDRKQPLMVFLDAVENVLNACNALNDAQDHPDGVDASVYASDELLLAVLRTHVVQDPARSRLLIPITMGMNRTPRVIHSHSPIIFLTVFNCLF